MISASQEFGGNSLFSDMLGLVARRENCFNSCLDYCKNRAESKVEMPPRKLVTDNLYTYLKYQKGIGSKKQKVTNLNFYFHTV